MKLTSKEPKSAVKTIARALEGLDQVTFHLDTHCFLTPGRDVPLITSQVTLWFAKTFPMKVRGGEDIQELANECRRKAEEALTKLKEFKNTK